MPRPLIMCAFAVLHACALPPGDAQVETSALMAPDDPEPDCPKTKCGGPNSPTIHGLRFSELHSLGAMNRQRVSINQVYKDGRVYRLLAQDDRLVAVDPGHMETVLLEHQALIGLVIRLAIRGQFSWVQIADVTPHPQPPWPAPPIVEPEGQPEHFWVKDVAPTIEAYKLLYTDFPPPPLGGSTVVGAPLCSGAGNDPSNGMAWAIAFEGDRFDAETKEISRTDIENWFTLACKWSAPYKVHRMGNTAVGAARVGASGSLEAEQAMLNAFTMRACGTATTYTEPGTMISLFESQAMQNARSPYPVQPSAIEAIWGPKGALCLGTPRVPKGVMTTSDAQKAAILKECNLDPCGPTLPPPWPTSGYVVTGIP